jgi:hypothetical protein
MANSTDRLGLVTVREVAGGAKEMDMPCNANSYNLTGKYFTISQYVMNPL